MLIKGESRDYYNSYIDNIYFKICLSHFTDLLLLCIVDSYVYYFTVAMQLFTVVSNDSSMDHDIEELYEMIPGQKTQINMITVLLSKVCLFNGYIWYVCMY